MAYDATIYQAQQKLNDPVYALQNGTGAQSAMSMFGSNDGMMIAGLLAVCSSC